MEVRRFSLESTALNPNLDSYPPSKFSATRTDSDLEEASDRRRGSSTPFRQTRLVRFSLAAALVLSLVSLWWLLSPSFGPRPEIPPPPPPPRDEVVLNLLDPDLYVKTSGASLLDQEHVEWGPYSLIVPDETKWTVKAGHGFPVVIQCDADIVGKPPCAPEYIIYLRGPVAEAMPSIPSLYQHDSARGRTEINVTVTQARVYDLWIIPEGIRSDPNHPSCPDENRHWYVKGSGQRTLHVLPSVESGVMDGMRECATADYEGPVPGCWVSLRHVRDEYRSTEWARSHLRKQDDLNISLMKYVYTPYRCKRNALDVAASLEALPSVRHVAYIGDSILRTSFCGHLYPSLHSGSFGGGCTPDDPKSSMHTAKPFDHVLAAPNGDRTSVKFSQRFLTSDTSTWPEALLGLGADMPVTHLVLNVGMWFVT